NELAVSMVRAGQEGGFLEDVLHRVAEFTEHQEDLKSKVVGALAYPIFLAVVGTIVLFVLVVFFVPRFEPIFKKLDEKGDLPAITSGLMGTSHFMINNWWWIIGGIVAGGFSVFRRAAAATGRARPAQARPRPPAAAA